MHQIKFIKGKRYKLVYARKVWRNGKWVYPRNAKVLRFWVEA